MYNYKPEPVVHKSTNFTNWMGGIFIAALIIAAFIGVYLV